MRRLPRLFQHSCKLAMTSGIFIFALLSICFAEETISVKAEVDKSAITIGDPILYTVTVKHSSEIKLASEIAPPSDPSFAVKKSKNFRKKEGGMIYEGKIFTLTAFGLGDYVLDPVQIQYLDAGGTPKTLQTDKIYISVKSVAEGEAKTDIRGIKSVLKIPQKVLRWILIILLLMTVVFAVIYFKTRHKPLMASAQETARSAEDEAFFQLNQLFDSDLVRREKIKEYYLKLSEILRGYFERRYQILAMEATTFEIERSLKEKEVSLPLRELIREVLDAADLAKFAKWKPEPSQIVLINHKAKQVIEMAAIKPAAEDGKEIVGGI